MKTLNVPFKTVNALKLSTVLQANSRPQLYIVWSKQKPNYTTVQNLHFHHRSKINSVTHIMPVRLGAASEMLSKSLCRHKRTELWYMFLFLLYNKSIWTATGLRSMHYTSWIPYIKHKKPMKFPRIYWRNMDNWGKDVPVEPTSLRITERWWQCLGFVLTFFLIINSWWLVAYKGS